MKIYLIDDGSLKNLEALAQRMPNVTKTDHANVKTLVSLIEATEQHEACWTCTKGLEREHGEIE